MTVSTTIRKAGPFAGTGLVSSYPFAFKVFTDDDLLVIRTPTGGADVTLVLASDYTVTLNPDQDAVPGGSVVLSAPLAVGYTLSIGSQVDSLQGLSLTNNGGFFPKAIENALDKLDIQDQQQEETLSRAVRVPFGSGAIPDLPTPAASTVLAWNASANALVNLPLLPVGAGLASLTSLVDAGAYWQSGDAEALSQEIGALLVNLRSMGADVTGTTDGTAALTAAFALSNYVYLPADCIVALDTRFELPESSVIFMGPGAEFKRRSAAASTDSVFWMRRKGTVIYGAGQSSKIHSEKACPEGVVKIGAADMATPVGVTDMFFCGLKALSIEGGFAVDGTQSYGQSGGNPDIGIFCVAPQIDTLGGTTVGNMASYFHVFDDLYIRKLNYGITMRGYANAMRGSNIHFERIGHPTLRGRALDFNGGGESCFVNCWHHFSPHSDGIYARSTTANTITYAPIGNQILNFTCEPGNAGSAKMFDIQAEAFTITGLNYTTTVPSWTGDHNIHVISPSHGTADINVTSGGVVHTLKDPAAFGYRIVMAATQAGVPFIIRTSAGATTMKIEVDGSVQGFNLRASGTAASAGAGTVSLGTLTQTTVGAAGAAAALPATPEKYLRMFEGTTEYVIPLYKRV